MVKIFGSTNCLYCLKCKQLCQAMEIDCEFLDVTDREAAQNLKDLLPETEIDSIPQVFWKDKHIGGYRELTIYIDDYISKTKEK